MATATAIGPTGPRVHQPRGGGARLTRTLVIVAGVAIATAMFVMIVALAKSFFVTRPYGIV